MIIISQLYFWNVHYYFFLIDISCVVTTSVHLMLKRCWATSNCAHCRPLPHFAPPYVPWEAHHQRFSVRIPIVIPPCCQKQHQLRNPLRMFLQHQRSCQLNHAHPQPLTTCVFVTLFCHPVIKAFVGSLSYCEVWLDQFWALFCICYTHHLLRT